MSHALLVFGWRTALLALVSTQVLILACSLLKATRNRPANRILAALLTVIVGLLTPFTIGFAGFYDAWPWLSFAPFAIPLAVGPLVYAYAFALITGAPPRRLSLHLAPAAVQFAYQATCFALPLDLKNGWNGSVHTRWIDPLVSLAAIGSLTAYARRSLRLLRQYRQTLGDIVSDENRYAAHWLRNFLIAVVAVLGAEVAFQGWELVFGRLNYFDVFGLYVLIGFFGLYLAVEGWRHAEFAFPHLTAPAEAGASTTAPEKDWATLGARWAARVKAEQWWADPDLSLPQLAARLGVNTHHLSRALNEGLGTNFATFINTLRSQAVADALAAGSNEELLTLALDAGFSSKASFNRCFKAAFDVTPSTFRQQLNVSKAKDLTLDPVLRRAEG